MLIQWGKTSSKGSQTISLPISFKSFGIISSCVITNTAASQTQGAPGGNFNSVSQIFIATGSGSHYGYWKVIGY